MGGDPSKLSASTPPITLIKLLVQSAPTIDRVMVDVSDPGVAVFNVNDRETVQDASIGASYTSNE
jgi:hypothetical protein